MVGQTIQRLIRGVRTALMLSQSVSVQNTHANIAGEHPEPSAVMARNQLSHSAQRCSRHRPKAHIKNKMQADPTKTLSLNLNGVPLHPIICSEKLHIPRKAPRMAKAFICAEGLLKKLRHLLVMVVATW